MIRRIRCAHIRRNNHFSHLQRQLATLIKAGSHTFDKPVNYLFHFAQPIHPMASFRLFLSTKTLLFIFLTALLICVEIGVTQTTQFSQHSLAISIGILFDLVFITAGLFYWLVARPLGLTFSRTLFCALLMLRLSLFILPLTSPLQNQFWPLLLGAVEATCLFIASWRIRFLIRTYRQLRPLTDAETAWRSSLESVLGKTVSEILYSEIITVYYAFLGWRLRPDVPAGTIPLTTYRESGYIALVAGVLTVGLIEGVGLHVLLMRWNPSVAFWVTLMSAYGLLFFIADGVATVKRPSYLTNTHVCLRLGVRWRATIPRSVIASVVPISDKPDKQADQLNAALLTTPNVLLTFTEPICLTGPYGRQKRVTRLSFFVDNRPAFVQLITERA